MQRCWIRIFTFGMLSAATLALAGILAAQEPSAPLNSSGNSPQEETAPAGKPVSEAAVEKRLQKLTQQLNLTDEQRAKIRPLLKHGLERVRQVRSNTSLSQGEAQRRIKLIHQDINQRIRQFLTPEQKEQWKEARRQQRNGPQGGEHGPSGKPTPDAPPAPANQN